MLNRRKGAVILPPLALVVLLYWPVSRARPQDAPEDPDAETHRAKLDLVVDEFSIKDAGFQQALDRLRKVAGVNVIVDGACAVGVDDHRKVTLSLTKVPVADVLHVLLTLYRTPGSEPLAYAPSSGVIWIGGPSGDGVAPRSVTYVYDISDFTARLFLPNVPLPPDEAATASRQRSQLLGQQTMNGPKSTRSAATAPVSGELRRALQLRGVEPTHLEPQECIDALVRLIEETVDPNGWRDNGGQVGALREFGGLLVVTNTFDNQAAVQRVLKNLRRARERFDAGAPPTTQPIDLLAP